MPLFSDIVIGKFPHEPTKGQLHFFHEMDQFVSNEQKSVFILKGYAGTGKTSIVEALVATLPLFNYKFLLLAPTGRAAKVMARYSHRQAFTIHKIIYKLKSEPSSGEFNFSLQKSYNKKTIFIVDEASMLSDSGEYGNPGLLQDLLTYVFTNEGNKLIIIGDTAQLPPVGQISSTSLNRDIYDPREESVFETTLEEVMRQELDSGILNNATAIRKQIGLNGKRTDVQFVTRPYKDIFRISTEKMEEGLRYSYEKFGMGNTIIVCRSNRTAVSYNTFIRRQILFQENELDVGDMLMVVRNNYTYSPPDTPSGFLANGDFMEVMKIYGIEEMHGFRFADLELKMDGTGTFEAKVLIDTLYTSSTSLSVEEGRKLYNSVFEGYLDIANAKKRREAIRADTYLNAVQVKFAYALTCHKSQGGQWDAVFIDQGFLKDGNDEEHLKWLYTAFTRATKELFLLNFDASQFKG